LKIDHRSGRIKMNEDAGWELVGAIGIDTAKCWIGDPSCEVAELGDEPGLS
jgi:hypothetical protein